MNCRRRILAERKDIIELPAPLKDRLVTLSQTQSTFPPMPAFNEAVSPTGASILSLGTFNATQENDAHNYREFNPGTNWVFPAYEIPFTGGGIPNNLAQQYALQSVVPGNGQIRERHVRCSPQQPVLSTGAAFNRFAVTQELDKWPAGAATLSQRAGIRAERRGNHRPSSLPSRFVRRPLIVRGSLPPTPTLPRKGGRGNGGGV